MAQQWAAEAQPRRRGGGLIWTGVVLLVLAILAGLVGIVAIGRGVGSLASGMTEAQPTPAAFSAQFETGREYTVYELTGFGAQPTVQVADITVVGEQGFSVPISGTGGVTSTFESGSDSFTAVAQFVAPTTGQYVVQVATEGTTIVVGPSLGDLVGVGVWGIVVAVAGMAGFVGLVLLIIGLVLRATGPRVAAASPYAATSAQAYGAVPSDGGGIFEGEQRPEAQAQPVQPAPAPQPVLPPAGWYPDPSRPGGQRYWDGARWTEHQA